MKKRLFISLVAAGIYTGVYAGILTWQGSSVAQVDLVVGALVFAVTFYVVRTWLDARRYRKADAADSQEETS